MSFDPLVHDDTIQTDFENLLDDLRFIRKHLSDPILETLCRVYADIQSDVIHLYSVDYLEIKGDLKKVEECLDVLNQDINLMRKLYKDFEKSVALVIDDGEFYEELQGDMIDHYKKVVDSMASRKKDLERTLRFLK